MVFFNSVSPDGNRFIDTLVELLSQLVTSNVNANYRMVPSKVF